jgi:glycosyltransferase involved in cell wall biosynthesis
MADAFVFPSMFEGLPLALIEAMCKGLPCIATRIGPHEELITHGQNGVLVQPGSVDELARAMLDLCLDADKRTRIGKQAQLDSLALFDIRETLPAWERLYQELACRENAVETSSTLAPSPYR